MPSSPTDSTGSKGGAFVASNAPPPPGGALCGSVGPRRARITSEGARGGSRRSPAGTPAGPRRGSGTPKATLRIPKEFRHSGQRKGYPLCGKAAAEEFSRLPTFLRREGLSPRILTKCMNYAQRAWPSPRKSKIPWNSSGAAIPRKGDPLRCPKWRNSSKFCHIPGGVHQGPPGEFGPPLGPPSARKLPSVRRPCVFSGPQQRSVSHAWQDFPSR